VAAGLRIQQQRIRDMGPAGRMRVASRLFYSARALKRAGLKKSHPEWNDEQLELKTSRMIAHAGQ